MIGDPESFIWMFVMKQVQVNPFRQPLTPSNKVLDLPMCSNAFIFGMNWRNSLNFTVHSAVEATSISWPDCTHLLIHQIVLGTVFQMEAIAAHVKFSMAIYPMVKLHSHNRYLTDTVTLAAYSVWFTQFGSEIRM